MAGERGGRRWRRGLILTAGLAAGLTLAGLTLAANPNERDVKPAPNVQDPDEIYEKDGVTPKADSKIWVLDFKFKDPRLIKVDVPGRGQKVCWYLWYQVINHTGSRTRSSPTSSWSRTTGTPSTTIRCCPRCRTPSARSKTRRGYLHIKNSVTIAAEPIPPSRENANPKAVTGVAIWDDVDPDSNNYSIYVAGLSNGWAQTDNPIAADKEPVVRRKTLELNFKRLGDRYNMFSEEIQLDKTRPYQWIYRASELNAAASRRTSRRTRTRSDLDDTPEEQRWLIRKVKVRSATAAIRTASGWASRSTAAVP